MSFTKRRLVCATVNRTAPSLPKLRHTEQQIKTPTPSPDTDADVGRPEGRIRAEADRTPTTPYLATAGSWRYVGYQFKSGGLVEELTFNGHRSPPPEGNPTRCNVIASPEGYP